MIIQLNDQNFEANIVNKDKNPIIVDFWSGRCEACRYNAPIADELSKELEGKIRVGKVNVDECPYTVGKYNIRVVPSMVLFQKGKVFLCFNGVVNKDIVIDELKKHAIA